MGTTTINLQHEQEQDLVLTSARRDAFAGEFDRDFGRSERVRTAASGASPEMGRHAAAQSLADELAREAGGTARVTRETEALLLATRARHRVAWMSRGRCRLRPEMGTSDAGP